MGRAPCCDKANVKKGPWSPEEDNKLKSYIEKHGTGGNWIALPQKIGLKRCGKSCRLRWLNYLRPNIKHGSFSEDEDNIICSLYISIGSRWSIIAAQLPGRTDNDIKNYWNTRLKKKLLGSANKQRVIKTNKMMIRGSGSSTVNPMETMMNHHNNNNQSPYWPKLPSALTNPTPNSTHESIRKLLVRLGGKFSDEQLVENYNVNNHTQSQIPPIEGHSNNHNNQQILYNEMLLSGEVSDYSVAPPDFRSQEIGGVNYNIDPDGLEFFYGSNNNNCGLHQDHMISWEHQNQMSNNNSLAYNNNSINVPIINVSENYLGSSEREMVLSNSQECVFGEPLSNV